MKNERENKVFQNRKRIQKILYQSVEKDLIEKAKIGLHVLFLITCSLGQSENFEVIFYR